jgi:hypothetical protein
MLTQMITEINEANQRIMNLTPPVFCNAEIGAELFLSAHRGMAPAQHLHQARHQLAANSTPLSPAAAEFR